jgi:hypothetical protein
MANSVKASMRVGSHVQLRVPGVTAKPFAYGLPLKVTASMWPLVPVRVLLAVVAGDHRTRANAR